MKENNLKKKDKLQPEDVKSIAAEVQLYKKALANMRELLTYYILHAFGTLCQTETVDQLKVLQQQHFLSVAYKHAQPDNKPVFTAQIAIDYLKKECYTTNERTITALKRQLERVVRYNGETLFAFLNRFPPLINELEAAMGKPFDASELTNLWRLNFIKHMNRAEKQAIKLDHGEYITSTEWTNIIKFNDGVFNFATMSKLLTKICHTLPRWKADQQVRSWNDQRKRDLQWDHEISYQAPESSSKKEDRHDSAESRSGKPKSHEKQGRSKKRDRKPDRGREPPAHRRTHTYMAKGTDAYEKRHRRDSDRGSKSKGRSLLGQKLKIKIPFAQQCKESQCISRGNSAGHEWANCHFKKKRSLDDKTDKSGSYKKKPFTKNAKNFGHKGKNESSSSSSKFKKKPDKFGSAPSKDRKCWNCGDPGHLSPDCPRQKKINHLLEKSQEFSCLLTEQFDTEELWECAQRIINVHGKPVCWVCCRPSCQGDCTVESDPISATMAEAHEIMNNNPDLGTTIQNAIHQVDGDNPKSHFMAPLNHEIYYQSHVGQDTRHYKNDDPMGLNLHRSGESASDSELDPTEDKSQASDNGSDSEKSKSESENSDNDHECHYNSEEEDL